MQTALDTTSPESPSPGSEITRQGTCRSCDGALEQTRHDYEHFPSQWFPTQCEDCDAKAKAKQAAEYRARDAAELNGRIARAGFEPKVIHDLERFTEPAEHAQIAREIDAILNRESSKFWPFLTGPVGVHKTTIAVRAAIRWMSAAPRRSVQYRLFPRFLLDIRETFSKRDVSELAVLRPLLDADLVILDDIASEKPSQYAGSTLFQILDARYARGARTILTSNCEPAEVARRLAPGDEKLIAERIFDRIVEAALWIPVRGKSSRDAAGAEPRDWKRLAEIAAALRKNAAPLYIHKFAE